MPDYKIFRDDGVLDSAAQAFYERALQLLNASGIPYLVGGAYAMRHYTGIVRHTKDLDIFARQTDVEAILDVFAANGFTTEITSPYWLAKAFSGEYFIDIIFSSMNGVAPVDDEWFTYAEPATVMNTPVMLMPPEEMLWQKAFIMERERYDGADVAHLLLARAPSMDWRRLLRRFAGYERVLFSHLILYGFIYPSERNQVPEWVVQRLLARMRDDLAAPPSTERVCWGTVLSCKSYLFDTEERGFVDARYLTDGEPPAVSQEREQTDRRHHEASA